MDQKNIWLTIIAIIIVAVLVGGGVYLWQKGEMDKVGQEIQNLRGQNKEIINALGNLQIDEDISTKEKSVLIEKVDSWKTYESGDFVFQYPSEYKVEPEKENYKVTFVYKDKTNTAPRIEIFSYKDFDERPFGFTGEETQEDIDNYVPKESRKLGAGMGIISDESYEIWLFYPKGDTETRDELRKIVDTIELK